MDSSNLQGLSAVVMFVVLKQFFFFKKKSGLNTAGFIFLCIHCVFCDVCNFWWLWLLVTFLDFGMLGEMELSK